MAKILVFIDSDYNSGDYAEMLESLMVDVVGIPKDEISFLHWESVEVLKNTIMFDDPDLMFVCGEKPLNQMFRIKGIRRSSGRIMDWHDHKVVPLLSPGYIESHPSELQNYAESIQKAYMDATGEGYNKPANEFVLIKDLRSFLKYVPYIVNAPVVSLDYEKTTLTEK